jgi:hypothetical protein
VKNARKKKKRGIEKTVTYILLTQAEGRDQEE